MPSYGLAASAVPTPYPSHLTSIPTQLYTPAFGGPSLAGLAAYMGRSHPTPTLDHKQPTPTLFNLS